MRPVLAFLIAMLPVATPVWSEGREVIGAGRIFNNDILGDGADRWRTGSYTYSQVRGRAAYTGTEGFGDLIEYRFRTEIIAPTRSSKSPGDRPYVDALSFGAHTHFDVAGTPVSVGADVMAIGPQTGLSRFQEGYHDLFELPAPPHTDQQLENAFILNGAVGATKTYRLSDTVSLCPFVEGQAGAEDLVRAGADVLIGTVGQSDLMLRDVVTGQLYRATEGADIGFSYLLGADVASVFGSSYLPQDMGYTVSETRARARAGVFWQVGDAVSFFYGATYLSEEFAGQSEGEVV